MSSVSVYLEQLLSSMLTFTESHSLSFLFLKMGFLHDGQAGLELLISGDPPTSASQSARITGVSHGTQSDDIFY